jgi:hypothetical protein
MPLTIEEHRRKLQYRVEMKKCKFATKSVYLLERPLQKGTTLRIGPHLHDIPKEAFLVIIDEAPGAYWTHPVRYELHDVATGEVHTIHEQYPLESPDIQAELVPLASPNSVRVAPQVRQDLVSNRGQDIDRAALSGPG